MPFVSNLAWAQRSSSSFPWGKMDAFDDYCVRHTRRRPPAPVMLRTPFRALNGKAYAVPLSMALEFDALLRRAAITNTITNTNTTNTTMAPIDGRALIAAPGVLWRHDPYSTKVLSPDSAHSASDHYLSATDSDIDSDGNGNGTAADFNSAAPLLPSARPLPTPGACRHVVIPPRPNAAVPSVGAPPTEGTAAAGAPTSAGAVGGKGGDVPRSLAALRSLPALFGDLAEHMGRRPARARQSANRFAAPPEDVQFVYIIGHRCRRSVCAAPLHYAVHETVVMEGDMGIEMGVVQTVLPVEEFDAMRPEELVAYGFPFDRDAVRAAFVLRAATDAERAHLKLLRDFEADLLAFLQNRLDPAMFNQCRVEHMEFLDCEFQADCKKIYVYYQAKQHVLYRELAQYLYSLYRCRIWLHEVGRGSPAISNDSSRGVDNSAEKESD